ncbi:chemotaxis protein CheW [Paenibacillus sp. P26]|nr:chemotaxis protein CheW [Paenibacillus sp. P26]
MRAAEHEQYVEFGMGEEQYAIRIQDIHEIIRMQEITQIPSVRSYVKGIISLRGKIVPVISLRSVFRQEEKAYSKSTRIILVHHGEDPVGIIVDRVHKVIAFSNIQPPPEWGAGRTAVSLQGSVSRAAVWSGFSSWITFCFMNRMNDFFT